MAVVKTFAWTCANFLGFVHLCNRCYILFWQVQYFLGNVREVNAAISSKPLLVVFSTW